MADDYVSRKAVRDRVLSLSLKRFELSDAYKVYVEAIKNAGVEIARTPAADVEPVVHGKFTRHVLKNANVPWGVDCSVCGAWFVIGEDTAEKYNYCPNCGAKMDGGKNV